MCPQAPHALPFRHLALTAPKPPLATYPRELKSLGDHLRKRRLDLGLLQREVAERLSVHKMTIANWETNRKSPHLRFLPKIVEFLDYVPEYTTPRTLRERILATRRLLGLTQKELARRLGVDPSTLGRWERGEGRPSTSPSDRLSIFLSAFPNRDTP